MNKHELMEILAILGLKDKNKRNSVVCSLIGHSKIRTFSWGYNYCGRCDAQLGDSLGGSWQQTDEYIEGHADEECLNALKKMDWKDKLYVPKRIYNIKKVDK